MKFVCCDRQALFVMDYKWPNFAPPEEQVIKINTMCTRCQKHWFGTEEDLREFTGKEWEKYVSESLKD